MDKSSTQHKKAIFIGCAKDCATYIPRVLANVSQMAGLFSEASFIFIENDSRDSTKHQLELWCRSKPNAHLISLDGLSVSCPVRTIRIATARNRYLSLVRSEFHTYDYLFVLDCDDVNIREIDLGSVGRAIQFLQQETTHAGVFANSEDLYYDMWALRHPERCPGDIWEEVCDYALSHPRASDEEAFAQTVAKRIFSIPLEAPPLEVDSAFGGLGIYKVQSILRNKRDYVGYKSKLIPSGEYGWQCCEHVSFNRGFREIGEKLFVLPYLVNSRATGTFHASVHASIWRKLLFDLRLATAQVFDPQNSSGKIPLGNIGRNQPCPCGSGQKYKYCHGAIA